MIWALARTVIFMIRIIFLTPVGIPLNVGEDFTVYQQRYLRCGKSEVHPEDKDDTKKVDDQSFSVVLKDWRFYVAVLGTVLAK